MRAKASGRSPQEDMHKGLIAPYSPPRPRVPQPEQLAPLAPYKQLLDGALVSSEDTGKYTSFLALGSRIEGNDDASKASAGTGNYTDMESPAKSPYFCEA